MKRFTCFLLVLLLAACPGCRDAGPDGDQDKAVLQKIDLFLKDAGTIFEKVESSIKGDLKTAKQNLDSMRKNLESGAAREAQEKAYVTRKKVAELNALLKQLEEMEKAVNLIPTRGSSRIDQTIAAAQHYFAKSTSVLEDLIALFTFRLDVDALMESVDSFDTDSYTDLGLMSTDLYNLVDETFDKVKALACPVFMQPTYAKYLELGESLKAATESLITVVQLLSEGIADHLRLDAIFNTLDRVFIQDLKFRIRLTEETVFQHERILERLRTGLFLLHDELKSNIRLLLASPEDGKAAVQNSDWTEYSYLRAEKKVTVNFKHPEAVYPSLYPSVDSLVILTATVEGEDTDILLKVEIPGFTQTYEQKLTLTEQITTFYIKPPPLTGELNLSSSKDAQIVVSLTDLESGRCYAQESIPIKLMSQYDFILWEDEFGSSNLDNAMAWLTPESNGILDLKRKAITWLNEATDGQFNSFQGYQLCALFGPEEYYMNVLYQVLGIQGAMSDMGVRYNMGAFSMTQGLHQRVLLPDDVLLSRSGVCIETALVMASALLSADMHVMLVFPPGHAQVAVETWWNTGEYFLIETTVLPFNQGDDPDRVIGYLSPEEWAEYLVDPWGDGSGPCYVVDCEFATKLGLLPLNR
ncbi:MAG TPA: hypothetical protein PK646_07155 [Bacillota bacterium]|jgi:hypothetical protein|nr:hypothetical protein [Fastidiosipila sp.]HPX93561.1 hypothetical protein [Bacillota bacterium]HQB81837.1 hypothetical protein [Bacillota bacterium]